DAGGDINTGTDPINTIANIYDHAQANVQRFVLPEMIRRVAEQDLSDLLARPAWKAFEFPRPHVFRYGQCHPSDPGIGTRLRMTQEQRNLLETAARNCVYDGYADVIARSFTETSSQIARYRGILGPSDKTAWDLLFRLATAERRWQLTHGRWATIEEIR